MEWQFEITGLFVPLRKIHKVWRKITCMFTLGLFKINLKKCHFIVNPYIRLLCILKEMLNKMRKNT